MAETHAATAIYHTALEWESVCACGAKVKPIALVLVERRDHDQRVIECKACRSDVYVPPKKALVLEDEDDGFSWGASP